MWVLAAVMIAPSIATAQLGKGKSGGRKVKLDLLAATDAVVPGETLQLGLRFTLEDRWHIYWQNSGESGMTPRIKWDLPAGFEPGEPAFPVPKRHSDAGGMIVTNILEDEPVLLFDVATSKAIDAEEVTLKAHVRYLICAENCIPGEDNVSVTLPVAATGAAANAGVFKVAQKRLPKKSSKYLTVTATTGDKPLAAGQTFELGVIVDIKKGYHIQSNTPTNKALFGCDLFVKKTTDVYWERAVFPKPKIRKDVAFGTLSEFTQKLNIRVPGEVDEEATGPFPMGGVFRFQACDGKGHCFPPEAVSFSVGKADGAVKVGSAETGSPETTAKEVVAETTTPAAPSTDTDDESNGSEGALAGSVEAEDGEGLEAFLSSFGLLGLLIGCFLWGLFINATPCVLPLLSIKVLGFVQQAHESRRRTLMLGLSFGAGVMLFFVVLGFLAAQGTNVLQSPIAVIALGAVVMAMALSMLGVYTLQVPTAATSLEASIQKEGMIASFGKGALAPVLGFACAGPLLVGAFGWATQQPPNIAIIAFLVAGLGMASPYMLLGANPNWLSFLPKPGNWMITFERIMGFLLLAMVVWLLHPLITHIGAEGLEWTLGFLVAVAMACWVWGKVNAAMEAAQRLRYRAGALLIVLIAGGLVYGWIYPIGDAVKRARADRLAKYARATDWSDGIPWKRWSPEAVKKTVRAGNPVFVDFTSAFCAKCQVNKLLATNTPEVRSKMQSLGVVPYKADYTEKDETIFKALQDLGRVSLPVNLIYAPGRPDKPVLLDTAFTKDYLLKKLDEVAGS